MARDGIHPFLGLKEINEGTFVVLFYEQDMGVVVDVDFNKESDEIYLGYHGEFDESGFEFLDPGIDVKLNNK